MVGKFGECFWTMHHSRIEDALWSPTSKRVSTKAYSELREKKPSYHSRFRIRYPEENAANHTGKTFCGLSNEVIDLVYEQAESLEDVIRLAVTCQRCYEISRRHLEWWVQQLLVVSWAGDRLICLGDYAEMDDLPPGMLTDEEREYLLGSCATRDPQKKLKTLQLRHPDSALRQMRIRDSNQRRYRDWENYLRLFVPREGLTGYRDGEALTNLVTTIDRLTLYTRDLGWYPTHVMRNLTTKEYVRGDAIESVRNDPDVPRGLKYLSFNHILAARFTWSSDPSLAMRYEGSLHRGVWAGHRFDVVEIGSVFNGQESLEGWKDVSEEVIGEVRDIARVNL
ncbi:hypothetical protein H0H81_012295 [Sphagnurus paluster]|uniref:F-box domain-containing protein n=1 Tax=Sphagnurus paluster TaxID=117069 RepID=A0A9P7K3H1_9AGAR|nr:hypothetical protein H0H81_012295 [Sphagnurus paluster]